MSRLLPLRAWVLAAAAAAVAGWFAAPGPELTPAVVKPRRDNWDLPALPRRAVDRSSLTMVVTAPYWGAALAAAPAPTTAAAEEDPRWRLAAIYAVGDARWALLSFDGSSRPPLRVRVGDRLPGGQKITAISEKDVCVQIGRQSYRLGIERREP